jgi:hypothetical protein
MNPQATQRTSRAAALTLVALQSLPCGCVSAIYRARPTVVELELVEAKGPHCLYFRHQTGNVVRLGLPQQVLADGEETSV